MPLSRSGRAVILPQRGSVPLTKQIETCLQYVDDVGWPLAAIGMADRPEDVIEMIRNGEADTVVVAYGGDHLAPDVDKAGGRVVAVHPTPHVVVPRHPILRSVSDLIGRLFDRGQQPHEIAQLLGTDTNDITEILKKKRR